MPKIKNKPEQRRVVFTANTFIEIEQLQKDGYQLPRNKNPWLNSKEVGVRKKGIVWGWSQNEISEYTKCATDVLYFTQFCHIKSEDGATKPMKIRDYQEDVLLVCQGTRVINMSSRQSGKTVTAAITILHYCLFNNDKNVMIVSNKADTVIEIIDKIKNIYKLLPFWMKPGIVTWNQKNISFENGCKIKCAARSKEPAIGFSIDFLYMDEFAHIPNTIVRPYYRAAIPTISNIKNSKIIITSTPNGGNLFKELVVGSMLPENDPNKLPYTVIKVYWYQVPDGEFADGVRGTRLDAKLYSKGELNKFNLDLDMCLKSLLDLGYKAQIEDESDEHGNIKKLIRIYHTDNSTIEQIRQLSINNHSIVSLFNINNWKEVNIKLIGGEENFNQEYNLQFVAGSKRILNAATANKLAQNAIKYNEVELDIIQSKLSINVPIKFSPHYIETERNKYYRVTSIDTGEGIGLDYTVFNGFKLMVREDEWLKENKIKSMYDAFYLHQDWQLCSNVLDYKTELADIYYLLHFNYFNPERNKTVLELNGPGGGLLAALPAALGGNNEFGTFIFTRYKHREADKIPKPGLKVSRNKKSLVKGYINFIEKEQIVVDEEETIDEMDSFVKVDTPSGDVTYKADSGHDDKVMTIVNLASFLEHNDYKNMCQMYYEELPINKQKIIDAALNLDYNPDNNKNNSKNNLKPFNKNSIFNKMRPRH